MKVILLSGVHGVGKGFFLEQVKKNIEEYNVYSASKLIERYKSPTDAGYKKVCNVNNNQDILIEAIKKEKLHSTKDFIIDGHLCVLNAEGKVERIPEYFFVDTGINGIVLLQDDPIVISQRINDRDAEKINVKDLREMQDEEYMYACELQNKFHIKYKVISHNYTGEQFKTLLSSIGGGFNE